MKYLSIDSVNRQTDSVSSSDFVANVSRLEDNVRFTQMRVISVLIPGSFYNINNTNRYLTIEQTFTDPPNPPVVTDYTISIASGNYNIATLAQQLQASIRANTNMVNFTVTYSETTGKLTLNSGSASYYFSLGPSNYSILEVLGFANDDTLSVTSITAPNVVNLSGYKKLYIRANTGLNVYSDREDKFTNILAVVPNTVAPFENIDIEFTRPLVMDCAGLSSLRIKLTDEAGRVIDLNGQNWSMIIELLE